MESTLDEKHENRTEAPAKSDNSTAAADENKSLKEMEEIQGEKKVHSPLKFSFRYIVSNFTYNFLFLRKKFTRVLIPRAAIY